MGIILGMSVDLLFFWGGGQKFISPRLSRTISNRFDSIDGFCFNNGDVFC